ncbi:MAG: M23 family metallopeptidase [Luteitalea sp.]
MMHVHRGRWWRGAEPASGVIADDWPPAAGTDRGDRGGTARRVPPNNSRPATAAALTDLLRTRSLTIPVLGVSSPGLISTFDQARGGSRRHEALDVMAPRGTPVVAVEDGTVVKLFTSDAGGLTLYQFDPSGLAAYYYAHLDRYASGLAEGAAVRRGQVLGYVGSTGNADKDAPHLHFAIFRLGPERRWWEGEPVDPFPVLRRE